ncbi:MAG: hypothetical protein ABI903_13325 [Actinomycetota bacterium]
MSTDNRLQAPAAGRRSAPTRWQPARILAVLLLLVGLGGYVVAAAADSSVAKTSAADVTALGQQDPGTAAAVLRLRVLPVQSAYDTYARASLAVVSARRDVTKPISQVRFLSTSGSARTSASMDLLSKGIVAYGAAVEREDVARLAYAHQLALLMTEVHR